MPPFALASRRHEVVIQGLSNLAVGISSRTISNDPLGHLRGHQNRTTESYAFLASLRKSFTSSKTDHLTFPTRDSGHDVGDKFARGGCRINPKVNRNDSPALLVGRLKEPCEIGKGTREPIKLRNNKCVCLPQPQKFEGMSDAWSIDVLAGSPCILDERDLPTATFCLASYG